VDSYDVPYEVSYRGSYGEVNKVVGQKTGCEIISHCLGEILLRKMPVILLYQENKKGGVQNDRRCK
jgi:hypothetical protein